MSGRMVSGRSTKQSQRGFRLPTRVASCYAPTQATGRRDMRNGPSPMLIILGGLPGVGKTTLARELARRIGAVHVRIDSIEQALRDAGVLAGAMDDAGYRVAYAVAADNLRLGRSVIADCVNPVAASRAAWRAVAAGIPVGAIELEVVCSDRDEHRRRIETRTMDIDGLSPPTWAEIEAGDYQSWGGEHVVIDTAGRRIDESVAAVSAILIQRSRARETGLG